MQNLSMLSSSVVFLLRQNLTTLELKRSALEQFLTPEISSAQTPDGRFVITSLADQMEVIIGGNRIDVRDRGRTGPRAEKISEVAHGILQVLNVDARAYGINYEFETDTPHGTSGAYLLEAFIKKDTRKHIEGLEGAALTLFFHIGDRQARIVIEPRRSRPEARRIFFNVNVHANLGEKETAPVAERLRTEIEGYFEKINEILSTVMQ